MILPSQHDKCQRGLEPVICYDSTVLIPLTHGQVAMIDLDDYHKVCGKSWQALFSENTRTYYARASGCSEGRKISWSMHRVVLDHDGPVDHVNHDTLDNRKSNLRTSSGSLNQRNARKRRGCSSRFKGVSFVKAIEKWHAYIRTTDRRVNIGFFDNEEDAALAYDAAASIHFGEHAYTNHMAGLL